MRARRFVLRSQANRDIEAAVDHYRVEAGPRVAGAFVDAIEDTFEQIRRSPAGGSPRYAHELDIPDLRHWRVKRHPYLVFYFAQGDLIDVLRVVHAHRDIPTSLRIDV